MENSILTHRIIVRQRNSHALCRLVFEQWEDARWHRTDAPAPYRTARRPGQSGEASEQRPGPSPLSGNATGPHAPYEADDPEGLAAGKHVREDHVPEPVPTSQPKKGLESENIVILGKDS